METTEKNHRDLEHAKELINSSTTESNVIGLLPEEIDRNRSIAIVDLQTIKNIAAQLRNAPIGMIIEGLFNKLKEVQSHKEYLEALKNEIAFHETVEQIEKCKNE